MALLADIIRGGQTWAHRMRMLKQVLRILLLSSTLSALLFFTIKISKEPKERFQAIYYSLKAQLPSTQDKVEVDTTFWCTVRGRCHRGQSILVPKKELLRICKPHVNALSLKAHTLLKQSAYFAALTFIIFTLFFAIRGFISRQKKQIDGTPFKKAWKMRLKMTLLFKASDLKLGALPLLKNSETQHLLICGSTGSGKTNSLRALMHQIRQRGDRAIIVDTTGDLLSKFFKEKSDLLLNPYDHRSQMWHPWCECQTEYDYEHLVSSLIPTKEFHSDDFFAQAARAVIHSLLLKYKTEECLEIESFTNELLTASVDTLYQQLKESHAQVYLDPKGERTTLSIRATIANCIRHLTMLKNSTSPFSINDWVLSDAPSKEWLFLTCQTQQRAALTPLLSLWSSIACAALKKRTPAQSKSLLWIIIDELHSLQKLEPLETALAELRKYGGALILTTQNVAQLDKIYGNRSASIILDQCGTKISFRQSDASIAKRMSSFFGERTLSESQEGLSYGAHEMRDGVNLSNAERSRATIPPTQILTLRNLEAFIKLPGPLPAVKSRFKYFKQKEIAPSYIAIED